jgi:plastocyanin
VAFAFRKEGVKKWPKTREFLASDNGTHIALQSGIMQLNRAAALLFTACAGAIWGCAETRSPISPTLPLPAAGLTRDTRAAAMTASVQRVDSDGDGYDDGEPATPMPGPEPVPGPAPGETPLPDGTLPPVQLTVNIVASFGSGAFAPNPLQAAPGNTIVWTNNDVILHEIVLDDGTPVGSLAAGQSSTPITVTLPTIGYRCTLHPSMVGQVTTVPPDLTIPTDGMPGPLPDPTAPPADPYGPSDDYGDDYYY